MVAVTARATPAERSRLRYSPGPSVPEISAAFAGSGNRTMTDDQQRTLREYLKGLTRPVMFLHHRMQPGADAQANEIAKELEIMTVGHPSLNPHFDAAGIELDFQQPRMNQQPQERNLVRLTRYMIVTPRTRYEMAADDAWRLARWVNTTQSRPVVIILPDGTTNIARRA